MNFRTLGRTGIKVSEIGIGTEHLNGKSEKTVISVIRTAVDANINYLDIVFAFKEYRENIGKALIGIRQKTILAGHISCAETNGHYRLSRDVKENEQLFNSLLKSLGTDYVDIVMIQMVNEVNELEDISEPLGLLELAEKFRSEGKARAIGISGHKTSAMLKAIGIGSVDVIMFPINIAWDFAPGRTQIFEEVNKRNLGLVAMKVFGGGRVFQNERKITPVQCINYALSRSEVSTVIPGVKNIKELSSVLKYEKANDEEKDFTKILESAKEELYGNCVYCNHCLPCPQNIDIGRVIQELDKINLKDKYKKIIAIRNFYYPGRVRITLSEFKKLSKDANKCFECGICMKRCPFGVEIIARMREAKKLLQ
jgi:predicted aldo/keto reductase-like oxidoreductase